MGVGKPWRTEWSRPAVTGEELFLGRTSNGGVVAGVRGSQKGDREAPRREELLEGKWAEPPAAEGAQGGLGLAEG